MADLFTMYCETVARVRPSHREWTIREGVSETFLWAGPAAFGVGKIELHGRTFELSDDGQTAVILPVADDYHIDTFEHRVADLLAFLPGDPSRWWTLRDACPIMGTAAIDKAISLHIPLSVWANPLSWLAADREGICVLDWGCSLWPWLDGTHQIWCENKLLARRVHDALSRPFDMPEIRWGRLQNAA